jgi:hypothetical protein
VVIRRIVHGPQSATVEVLNHHRLDVFGCALAGNDAQDQAVLGVERYSWSQHSPLCSSAGSERSQCFSFFLATNNHFSSNWTSSVFGGKSHEFVMGFGGVLTC